jgi:hypothetical protein
MKFPKNSLSPLNDLPVQTLHTLVDGLNCTVAKQQLHTLLDDLNEEQVLETLTRLRDLQHHSLEYPMPFMT